MLKDGHRYWLLDYEVGSPITNIMFYLNINNEDLILDIHTYSRGASFGIDIIEIEDLNEATIIKPIKFEELDEVIRKWVKKNNFIKEFSKLLGDDNE